MRNSYIHACSYGYKEQLQDEEKATKPRLRPNVHACHEASCRYCHDKGEHQFIDGQHKEECFKFPYPVITCVRLRLFLMKIHMYV